MGRRTAVLAYACTVAAVIAVGLWVLAPTLNLGLMADDYMAIAVARGELSAPRHPLDTFAFALGNPADLVAVQRLGTMPWWTPPEFRLSFMRPLAGALWHLDEALFGREVWLYHAHSLAVWTALAIAAGAFYRQLFAWPVAALACAIFALDESQHMPVLWLSNRGGLYAVLFGVLALHAHVAWRRGGSAWLAGVACACIALGLSCGEWALPMLSYFVAYELIEQRGAWLRRLLALVPAGSVALGFLALRAALGYGARGSGVYVDPTAEPARFAGMLAQRFPVFALDLLSNVPSEWWDHGSPWRDRLLDLELISPLIWAQLPDWRTVHLALGLGTLLLAGVLFAKCMRALPVQERRTAGFLLAGAALSLVPVAGSFSSTRLTLGAMLGVAGCMAVFMRHLARLLAAQAVARRRAAFGATWTLLVATGYAQLLHPLGAGLERDAEFINTARNWVLSAELDVTRVAEQRVMMLASSDFITTHFWAYTWHYHRRPMPKSFYPLFTAPTAYDIERPAPNALLVRPLAAALMESPGELMFRAPELTFRDGESVTLPGLVVRIESTRDGHPTAVRLIFEVPVDDPSLAFIASTSTGLTRVELPDVGGRVRLSAPSPPSFRGLLVAREQERFGPYPEVLAYAPSPWFVAYEP